MPHTVYRILCPINDRVYFGVATDAEKQISNHLTGSGSRLIWEDVQEHGRECFIAHPIDDYETQYEATKRMQMLILRHNALYPFGYNMSLHGSGSKGSTWSVEQRAKITGSRNARSKLTEAQVAAIFWDARPRSVIAKEFGVSTTMVTKIKKGQAWKHVTEWLVSPRPADDDSDEEHA